MTHRIGGGPVLADAVALHCAALRCTALRCTALHCLVVPEAASTLGRRRHAMRRSASQPRTSAAQVPIASGDSRRMNGQAGAGPPPTPSVSAVPVQLWAGAAVAAVPLQMWAAVAVVPLQMWAAVTPVLLQMWVL